MRTPAWSHVFRTRALVLALLMLAIMLAGVSVAFAGTVPYWSGVQPIGDTAGNQPIVAYGDATFDGKPLVSSSLKLYVDGALVPRASYSGTVGSQYVYVYYAPRPSLTDGSHTFRIEVQDTVGKLSFREWTTRILQAPTASWVSPLANATVYTGRPRIVMSLSDNTPSTTFTVVGQVRSGSSSGPVVATCGQSGLTAGQQTLAVSSELVYGTYYLTATVTDAAGNSRVLNGTSARKFTAVSAPAMTVLESCDSCHSAIRNAHPTPAATDCGVCHPDNVDDHMQGTDYCEDCHWDGWHNTGGLTVTVTSQCSTCHTASRPEVVRHTASSTSSAHDSSCGGCHYGTLITQHSATPVGSTYAYQCDVCHGNPDPVVKAAIAGENTSCSGCHIDGFHADFDVKHEAPTDTCVGAACHSTRLFVDMHEPYVGPSGRYPQYASTCELCHQNEDPDRIPADASSECVSCHPERAAFHGYEAAQHTAVLGSGTIEVFGNHDGWMGSTSVSIECAKCHSANMGPIHAMVCSTCHPTPRGTFTTWTKNCSQGGCHTSYHASGFDHDEVASGNCSACHDEGAYQLYDDPCVACHAHPDASDTTPPVTQTNILSSYNGAARIYFSATDGGSPAIGMTFRRLDGAAATTGDMLEVTTPGSHTLEYWSVDQYGNAEAPRTVGFTVVPDTTPPVTTSNAAAAYEGPATILLSATDSSYLGVKGTYYTLNGGAVQTGRTIAIPQPPSGTVAYTLEFWSDDYSGNVETHKVANFTVTRDTTPPTSTFTAQAFYAAPTVSIPYTAVDSGSGVQLKYFRVDGGALQSLPVSATYLTRTFATQGPHSIEYWSVDKVGNAETHRTAAFNIDWTQPTVSSNALTSYPETGANITITAVDQPSNGAGPPRVVYRLDNAAPVTAGAITTVSETDQGNHVLEFWAVDLAGNSSAHTTVSFTVGTAPEPTGEGTLRLIWGDGSGPSPNSWANWTIRDGGASGPIVATGSGATNEWGGGWDGIDDVVVPAQPEPYWVGIQWYDDYWPEYGEPTTVHFPVYVTADGQMVELHY